MPPHGAGGSAFTMVPGGVRTVRGRKAPELTSAPGSRNDLMIVKAPVGAMAAPKMVGPAVCGEETAMSTAIASEGTTAFARAVHGRQRYLPGLLNASSAKRPSP